MAENFLINKLRTDVSHKTEGDRYVSKRYLLELFQEFIESGGSFGGGGATLEYTDISLNDASAAELANTVTPGWYRITEWNTQGVETNGIGFYTSTYENDDGNVRFFPIGLFEIYDSAAVKVLLTAAMDLGLKGIKWIYDSVSDCRITVDYNSVGAINVSTTIPWRGTNWEQLDLHQPSISYVDSTNYLKGIKGSFHDNFFISNTGLYINGLNPGQNRTIYLNVTSIENLCLGSNRELDDVSGTNCVPDLSNSLFGNQAMGGMLTCFAEVPDDAFASNEVIVPRNFGAFYCTNSGDVTVEVITAQGGGNIVDGDTITFICTNKFITFTNSGNLILDANYGGALQLANPKDFASFRYDSYNDKWTLYTVTIQ